MRNLPEAGLIDLKGTLYGSRSYSGGACDGQVPSSRSRRPASRRYYTASPATCRGKIDGAVPLASLINMNGLLYGTTGIGGGHPRELPQRWLFH